MTDNVRQNISSNTIWEEKIGSSRAVRVGDLIEASGRTATDGSGIVGEGNIYEQTKFIFLKIEKALEEAGAGMKNIIRTRMYLTDISQAEIAGRVHAGFFGEIRPAASMLAVSGLIDLDLLIEIDVTAVIGNR